MAVGHLLMQRQWIMEPRRDATALQELADAIAKFSRLADDESVVEAEINPLIVREQGQGVVAVDALLRQR